MRKNFSYIFTLFLFFYLISGLYLSTHTGITSDEAIEQANWKINIEAIKAFFTNNNNGYSNLLEYFSRFYGIGFHYLSQIYLLLAGLVFKFESFSEETSKLLLNHSFVFLTYFLSGIFAKKIVNLIIKDKFFSNIFFNFLFILSLSAWPWFLQSERYTIFICVDFINIYKY